MKSSQKAGADRPAGPKSSHTTRKRKRHLGFTCDRICEVCRTPCDNPFHPEHIKKDEEKGG